ncbi:TIL domain-containing protein, partial [Trichostrongylus colubriformis]
MRSYGFVVSVAINSSPLIQLLVSHTPQRTCDNVRCPAGTECQQVPLNCLLPPCPQPPPQCVPIEKYNPCAATTCPVGSECRSRDVVCVRAPCNPVAECVPTKQDPQCNQNESYRSCASQCEPTCSNKNPTCILSCAPGRCQCNIGFYRNSSGSCVTEADCDGTAQQPTPPRPDWTGLPPLELELTCNETSQCANRTHERPTHLGADCNTSYCSTGTVCQMVVVKDIHAAQRIKEPQ